MSLPVLISVSVTLQSTVQAFNQDQNNLLDAMSHVAQVPSKNIGVVSVKENSRRATSIEVLLMIVAKDSQEALKILQRLTTEAVNQALQDRGLPVADVRKGSSVSTPSSVSAAPTAQAVSKAFSLPFPAVVTGVVLGGVLLAVLCFFGFSHLRVNRNKSNRIHPRISIVHLPPDAGPANLADYVHPFHGQSASPGKANARDRALSMFRKISLTPSTGTHIVIDREDDREETHHAHQHPWSIRHIHKRNSMASTDQLSHDVKNEIVVEDLDE